MSATLKEIAMMAGVSRGTVDRALNNRGGVNPVVEQRIRAIARELGYTPNRAGKALAVRKNPIMIGVVISSVGNAFFDDILRGMMAAQAEFADFDLKVSVKKAKGYDADTQIRLIRELAEEGAGALAVTPISEPAVAAEIDRVSSAGIPVFTVNSDIENTKRVAYIGCDYGKSGRTAAGLLRLVTGGRANAAVVTGSRRVLGHNQRMEGFLSVCRATFQQFTLAGVVENNDDDVTSYIVTRQLLKEHPDIDAFYFTAAGVGGAFKAIDEHAFRHGRPAVVSCDSTEEIISLIRQGKIQASVCQQPFRQGYETVRTVFEYRINHKKPPEYIHMLNEIVIKENLS